MRCGRRRTAQSRRCLLTGHSELPPDPVRTDAHTDIMMSGIIGNHVQTRVTNHWTTISVRLRSDAICPRTQHCLLLLRRQKRRSRHEFAGVEIAQTIKCGFLEGAGPPSGAVCLFTTHAIKTLSLRLGMPIGKIPGVGMQEAIGNQSLVGQKLLRNPRQLPVRTYGVLADVEKLTEYEHSSAEIEGSQERPVDGHHKETRNILDVHQLKGLATITRRNVLAAVMSPQQPGQQIGRVVAVAFDSGRANDRQPIADDLVQSPLALRLVPIVRRAGRSHGCSGVSSVISGCEYCRLSEGPIEDT